MPLLGGAFIGNCGCFIFGAGIRSEKDLLVVIGTCGTASLVTLGAPPAFGGT